MPSAIKRQHAQLTLERSQRTGKPRCAYCGCVVSRKPSKWSDTVRQFTMDHVVPRSEGGLLNVANLLPACLPCNNARGDMPLDQFIARLPGAVMTVEQARAHIAAARAACGKNCATGGWK